MTRLLEAVEKARIIVSGDTEARVNVDYLLDDESLDETLTEEVFKEIIAPYNQRLSQLIERFLDGLQTKHSIGKGQIDRIELLGDCSRNSTFELTIKTVFGLE